MKERKRQKGKTKSSRQKLNGFYDFAEDEPRSLIFHTHICAFLLLPMILLIHQRRALTERSYGTEESLIHRADCTGSFTCRLYCTSTISSINH